VFSVKQELISKCNSDEFHASRGYTAKHSSFSFMAVCYNIFLVLLKGKKEELMGKTYGAAIVNVSTYKEKFKLLNA
jgi:hypothetical protein